MVTTSGPFSSSFVQIWTLKEATIYRVEVFEMWTLRRMLKVSWVDHVTNEDWKSWFGGP